MLSIVAIKTKLNKLLMPVKLCFYWRKAVRNHMQAVSLSEPLEFNLKGHHVKQNALMEQLVKNKYKYTLLLKYVFRAQF